VPSQVSNKTLQASAGVAVVGEFEVRAVCTRRDLTDFIKLPWKLYSDAPNWVPPLIHERRHHLDRGRNPFFEHAEAEYFLAWSGGRPIGRISAHVDRRFNKFQGNRWGLFGFFECVEDLGVAGALFAAAESWLRARGCDRMVGPMDFSTNHECGLLVEGHELMPQILENWHHPYYTGLFESVGMRKAMDLYKWQIIVAEHDRVLPVIYELADSLEAKHGIRVRHMRRRDFEAEVQRFMEVYNEAWEGNWGFVPLTQNELQAYAKELKPILDERYAYIAEKGDEVVGAALTLPDVNKILAKLNGRLVPLGWLRFLRERRRIDELRVFALGVKRDYRHTGTAAAFYAEHWRDCRRHQIRRVETGWILETNEPMNHAMEALGGDVVKRYRLYERRFERPDDDESGLTGGEQADLGRAHGEMPVRGTPGRT
jgi:GNAT superfamily N-acetyltransferase